MNSTREWIYKFDELDNVASEIYEIYNNSRIFCLKGILGAGKTTLIKSFCKQLSSLDEVTSPTFSIINQYSSNFGDIYHLDLYRLNSIEEIIDIGIEEYLNSGNYCFIEWYEKIKAFLPYQNVVYCEIKIINTFTRRIITTSS